MAKIFNPDNPGTDSIGRFLDKNVQAGIGGTVIFAETLNQLGDESDALIKAAGLTPSNKDVTQWLQAIRKLYGDADTALKEELISKIEALKASDIAFDDSIGISASDVQEAITALHTLIKELKAKDIAIENIDGITASNVQELGEALNEKGEALNKKIDKEVEIIVDEKIPVIYDYSGAETLTNKIAKFSDGSTKPIYRKYIEKKYDFIRDEQEHSIQLNFSGIITKINGYVYWGTTKFDLPVARISGYVDISVNGGLASLGYILKYSDPPFQNYILEAEYYK